MKTFGALPFTEAGLAVVARFFGLRVGDHLEIVDDGRGKTEIGPANHLARIDQITVCIAGVAAQDLFGFSRPEAGYSDHAQIAKPKASSCEMLPMRGPERL